MLRETQNSETVSSGYHLQSNVRRSGPTRIWRQLSTVSPVIIRLPGPPTSLGSNMLIILWFPLPRVCWLSWSLCATSLHFFRFRSLMWPFLLFNITSVKPTESGGRHELPSPGRLLGTRDSLIDTTLQPPSIRLVRKCGYPRRNIPLQVESRKMAPRHIGPFEVEQVINPSVVRLKLPPSFNIHPSFNIFLLKPVSSNPLTPPTKPPPRIINDHSSYAVKRLLDIRRHGQSTSIWLIERVMVQRSAPGSHAASSWIPNCSPSSMPGFLKSLSRRVAAFWGVGWVGVLSWPGLYLTSVPDSMNFCRLVNTTRHD